MKYVESMRDVKCVDNKVFFYVTRDMKLDVLDWLILSLMTLTAWILVFAVGMRVGEIRATQQMPTEVIEVVEEAETETYSDKIPLEAEEQKALRDASEEFGVDYYVMLGLVEKETNFRNIPGDGGNASGYCQVWRKWWSKKMTDIGAEDLNVPKDNFRTACAIVRELTDRYGSVAGALTAYNKGSFNGRVSAYATSVLENAEKWREIEKSHL